MNDVNSLIQDSNMPAPLCNWLQCLRTPGISLSYTIKKQHIPDMTASSTSSTKGNGGNTSEETVAENNTTCRACNTSATDTKDQMTLSGDLRVRYFDLAVGALGILTACALLKLCMGGCRCICKKMF